MQQRLRRAALLAVLLLPLAALPAAADHSTRPSENLRALGHSEHPAEFFGPDPAEREVSSDIAFWGQYAIHGNYDGFRIVDISVPGDPQLVSHPRCNGDQGDVYVYENIVVRSWNSPAPEGRTCDGEPVPVGFEGVHVFDISDPANPELISAVEFSEAGAAERGTADGCGSHTLTGVPDLVNDRLFIYSNNSSGGDRDPGALPGQGVCDAMDQIVVPLGAPAEAFHFGKVPLMGGSLGRVNGCHDAAVILGDLNLLACASGHAANVFSIGAPRGGTLEDPNFLYTIEEEDDQGNKVGVGGRWHSAAFTWDGEVLILGWEPGGGAAPQCEATDADIFKSKFFYDVATGEKLGQWVLPRPQTEVENCTIHNYNIVPLRSDRYVAVGGHYQAGTWVVDFTDPANPETLAWSDPPPLEPENLGGAWSSYWYNDLIFESVIQEGLNVFEVVDQDLGPTVSLGHLNPQTQLLTLPLNAQRLAGRTRIETAIAVSQASFGEDEAGTVVLARADEPADALAGTPLAIANDGPILLTHTDELPEATADELQRVLAEGDTVHVVGGIAAVDESVVDAVQDLGFETVRISGATRIETSVEIAGELGDPDPLLITTGYNFPDALAAGAAAGNVGGAVLLTTSDEPHPAIDAYLDERPDDGVALYAVGGPAARAYPDAESVSGPTREETAVLVAETFFDDPAVVGVARRDDFPDALTGGAHVGRVGGPVLLTPTASLHSAPSGYLCEGAFEEAFVYGGHAAIDEDTFDAIADRIAGEGC